MSDYQRDVFGLLVRRGDVEAIQIKVNECLGLALEAVGGVDTALGRELRRLAADFAAAQTMEQLDTPLIALKGYLKDLMGPPETTRVALKVVEPTHLTSQNLRYRVRLTDKYQDFRTLSMLLIPCEKNDLTEAEGFLNGLDQAVAIHPFVTLGV
jgi:hypothetical protein